MSAGRHAIQLQRAIAQLKICMESNGWALGAPSEGSSRHYCLPGDVAGLECTPAHAHQP